MLIWRGWGIVVFGVAIVAFALGAMIASALGVDDTHQLIAIGIVFMPAAVALWYLGKRMNASAVKTLVDPATGEEVRVDRRSSFFFIPVEWWGPVGAALGVLLILLGLVATPEA
jgi:hypothetical protein